MLVQVLALASTCGGSRLYHFVPSRLLLASHDAVACVLPCARTHTHTYRMYRMYYLQNGKPTRHTEIRTRTQTAVSCTVLNLSLSIKAERLQCQTPEHAGALSPALSCAYSSLHGLISQRPSIPFFIVCGSSAYLAAGLTKYQGDC